MIPHDHILRKYTSVVYYRLILKKTNEEHVHLKI